MSKKNSGVLAEVAKERERQDAKWGGPKHDDTHTLCDWAVFIFERMKRMMNYHGAADPMDRKNLIQIAAIAVAAVESIDRTQPRAQENAE